MKCPRHVHFYSVMNTKYTAVKAPLMIQKTAGDIETEINSTYLTLKTSKREGGVENWHLKGNGLLALSTWDQSFVGHSHTTTEEPLSGKSV